MTSHRKTQAHTPVRCHCHLIVLPNWGVREGGEEEESKRGGDKREKNMMRLARGDQKKREQVKKKTWRKTKKIKGYKRVEKARNSSV